MTPLLPTEGCPACVTGTPIHPWLVKPGRYVCEAPGGRLYPCASDDADTLAAVAETGYVDPPAATKTLWQVSLVPLCPTHAPAQAEPAWMFASQTHPCDHIEPGDGVVAFYYCTVCGHHWWTSWDLDAASLPCPGCELCQPERGVA